MTRPRHFLFSVVTLGVLLAVLAATPASAIEIVYPSDGTSVDKSNFLIIKGGEPQLSGISIEINGVKSDVIEVSSPQYRAAFKDFLILEPDFDPGINRISVEGVAGGQVVRRARAEIFFRANPDEAAPGKYRQFVMHLPEKEALCAPCHNMNPSEAQMNAPDAKSNPCLGCHARLLKQAHVHGPAGVGECGACHERSGKPSRYQPRPGDALLCKECHADKVADFRAKKFVHGPIEANMCMVCHDPHASDQAAQLNQKVNALCLSCHEKVKGSVHVLQGVQEKSHPLEGPVNPANPYQLFNCVSCHDPHGGMAETYFRKGVASRYALCSLCHKK